MARPTKQGIDYFPLDTEFDDAMCLFSADAGGEGIGILITIWQAIYKGNGYYIDYDDVLPLKIRAKCFSNVENIVNSVEKAVYYNIFDKSMFEKYRILTSRGIQKRYFIAARSKKSIEINPNFLLVDVSNMNNVVFNAGNSVNVVGNATKEEVEVKEEVKEKEIYKEKESLAPSRAPVVSEEKKVIKRKQTQSQTPVEIPDWLDLKLWNDFLDMRKKLRKPMTERAKILAVKKLEGFHEKGDNVSAILEQSILNSWTGIYELKDNQKDPWKV